MSFVYFDGVDNEINEQGWATPTSAAATNFGTGDGPGAEAVGDFNADGKADVEAANANFNGVTMRLREDTGNFGADTNLASGGTSLRDVQTGDFNQDGKLDGR